MADLLFNLSKLFDFFLMKLSFLLLVVNVQTFLYLLDVFDFYINTNIKYLQSSLCTYLLTLKNEFDISWYITFMIYVFIRILYLT